MLQEHDEIQTDDELFNSAYAKDEEQFSFFTFAKTFIHDECNSLCSASKLQKIIHSVLPISKWLPEYKVARDLLSDIAAGITVGVVHLPQGLAYALLAQLPLVNGLYTSLFPVLVYALFGTTKHLSVGTFAVVSLMVGEAISNKVAMCPDEDTFTASAPSAVNATTTNTASAATTAISASSCNALAIARSNEIAIALCVAVAIIHFGMYVFRLGILYVYLSSHMVSGFTCGAAFHVFTSQVSSLVGIRITRKTGVFSIVYTYIDLFRNISSINWATVVVSLCNCVFLIIGKEINRRYSKKLPFPIPWELGVVIFSTLASTFGYLNENYDVRVVGEIPQGIQTSLPIASDLGVVFPDAIPIAIVTFSISISLSLLFSEKHAYDIDANQELLAYSLANVVGSFFQCFPCAASLSRTLVWEQSGGKTQLTGCVSSVLVLITLLWIGPLFQQLPNAALAAIIMVNLKNLLKQFNRLPPLWKVSKIDAVSWFVTWVTTTFLGVDIGLYVGVAFSLFTVVLRTQITYGDVMVAVGQENLYRSSKRFQGRSDTDIVIFKFPSPLIYANQIRFKHQLSVALRFNPQFEVALRKQAQEQAKRKAKKQAKSHSDEATSAENGLVIQNPENEDSPISIAAENPNMERYTASGVRLPLFVILDMSICSFIDNDGVILIKSLLTIMSDLNIRLLLARCTADVRRCLLNGDFPNKDNLNDDSPIFFVSLDKAVLYAKMRKASILQIEAPQVDRFVPARISLRSSLASGKSKKKTSSEKTWRSGDSTPDDAAQTSETMSSGAISDSYTIEKSTANQESNSRSAKKTKSSDKSSKKKTGSAKSSKKKFSFDKRLKKRQSFNTGPKNSGPSSKKGFTTEKADPENDDASTKDTRL